MFPRVTHPSATPALLRAFDLHVLSLPPAFALSQDQTLKLESDSKPGLTHVLTEVHEPRPPRRDQDPQNLETQGPASSSKIRSIQPESQTNPIRARTPPSAFLFLQTKLSKSKSPHP